MTTPGRGKLVLGDSISKPFVTEITSALSTHTGRKPKLVGILGTASGPSIAYASWTRKACQAVGLDYELRVASGVDSDDENLKEATKSQLGIEELVLEANDEAETDGIMVYYPIFGGRQDQYLQQVVSPLKDVEGLNFVYNFNLYHNIRYLYPSSLLRGIPATTSSIPAQPNTTETPDGMVKSILPCTPLAIVKCLEHVGVYNKVLDYGDRAYGKVITVINRSEVVGRPLAALLANDGARVFSADIGDILEFNKRPNTETATAKKYHPHHVVSKCSMSLEDCLAISDVVISGVPSASYKVSTSQLKQGCVAVNFSSEKNFDTDVRDKAGIYIPAVGKVTVAMLQRNLLRLKSSLELARREEQK